MSVDTEPTIRLHAKSLFARGGYEAFSMRTLAAESGVGISSIYHFFADKDELLHTTFHNINRELGTKRAKLPARATASDMLLDRIIFQFENIEDVVFVLKYYLHFRDRFQKLEQGFFPAKGYLHVEEVLEFGRGTGEFVIPADQQVAEAKITAHAINGFLLEYYPSALSTFELMQVCQSIHRFVMRSLTNREVNMP